MQFGYPTGPQSVAAVAAEATNASLLDAFNGLLLAIPVLTALAALAALDWLPAGRRVVAASLAGLPYLAASFLAQSAFKETAMALLVLAFAVALGELGRPPPADDRQPHPRRAMVLALILLAVGERLRLQPPGAGLVRDRRCPIWLALELGTGRLRIDVAELRAGARRHRAAIVAVAVVVVAVGAFSAAQLSGFVGKVGKVQASVGQAQLAGVPRRGPRDLAGGRFPGRPGRRRRRLSGAGAGPAGGGDRRRWRRSAAATGGWWRWAPRR